MIVIAPEIKVKMDEVVSVNENSTTELQYDYCENEGDGRGFTAGRAGFTTSDGDALGVILQYGKGDLMNCVQILRKLEASNSDSTFWLRLKGYREAWKKAALDKGFRDAQDIVSDREYYTPALTLASQMGLSTALGVLCFYDTCIQHCFDGPDSLNDIANFADKNTKYGPDMLQNEYEFLTSFLRKRRAVLMNPQDSSTQKEWSESVGRADALASLVSDHVWDLKETFHYAPFDDEFVIS